MRVLTKQNIQILAGVSVFLFLVCIALGVGFVFLFKNQQQQTESVTLSLQSLEYAIASVASDVDVLRLAFEETGASDALRDAEAKKLAEELGALSENVTTLSEDSDIAAIAASWGPYVYATECDFRLADGSKHTARASATLIREHTLIRMLTNKHVVTEENSSLEECSLKRFDSDVSYEVSATAIDVDEERDIAKGTVPDAVSGVGETYVCSQRPVIGDRVLILGYPGIGSQESVTATEGIISGFDEDYYTTSAKIDKGNSGGAAIDIKNDCLLGIPTLVYTGKVESLARILPLQ